METKNNTMSRKPEEGLVLESFKPFLESMYGLFDLDPGQIDKPDAAIILKTSEKRIGIELTTFDSEKFRRFDAFLKAPYQVAKINKNINELDVKIENNISTTVYKPILPGIREYVYHLDIFLDSIFPKLSKFDAYAASNEYHEIILLLHSDHFEIEMCHGHFLCIVNHTFNKLLEKSCRFNKIIYFNPKSKENANIFSLKNKQVSRELCDECKKAIITNDMALKVINRCEILNFTTMRPSVTYDFYNFSPLFEPKNKKQK